MLMSRPYRAQATHTPQSQGFALGWYIAPFQGSPRDGFSERVLCPFVAPSLRRFHGHGPSVCSSYFICTRTTCVSNGS